MSFICFLLLSLRTRISRRKWQYMLVYIEMEWWKLVRLVLQRTSRASPGQMRQVRNAPVIVQMADCTWHYAKTQNDRLRRLTAEHSRRTCAVSIGGVDSRYWSVAKLRYYPNQQVNVAMAMLYTFIQLHTTTPFTLNAFSVMTTHCVYR